MKDQSTATPLIVETGSATIVAFPAEYIVHDSTLGTKRDAGIKDPIEIVSAENGTGKRFQYLYAGTPYTTAQWFSVSEAKETIQALLNLSFISEETARLGIRLLP